MVYRFSIPIFFREIYWDDFATGVAVIFGIIAFFILLGTTVDILRNKRVSL